MLLRARARAYSGIEASAKGFLKRELRRFTSRRGFWWCVRSHRRKARSWQDAGMTGDRRCEIAWASCVGAQIRDLK